MYSRCTTLFSCVNKLGSAPHFLTLKIRKIKHLMKVFFVEVMDPLTITMKWLKYDGCNVIIVLISFYTSVKPWRHIYHLEVCPRPVNARICAIERPRVDMAVHA